MSESKPREWWIDDVTERSCAPWDHPTLGIETMKWPDNERVIHVIEHSAYAAIAAELAEARDVASKFERAHFLACEKRQAERERAFECSHKYDEAIAALEDVTTQRDQARAEVERLRGDRDKWLASDDCYYWTPKAQDERDQLKAALERIAYMRRPQCAYCANIAREALEGK